MRLVPFLLAAVLGVATAGLVACGSSGDERRELIPQRSASRLKSALAEVRRAVAAGDCADADQAISRARGTVGNLPASVNDRLVARLRQGLDNLESIAPRDCREQTTQTTTVPTTTTTTPEATTPTTATTGRSTTPTSTTSTTTTTTSPTTGTGTTTAPEAGTTGATTPPAASGGDEATTP